MQEEDMDEHPPRQLNQGDRLDQAAIEELFDTGFGYQISGINPRRDDRDQRFILVFAKEDGPYRDSVHQGRFEYIGEGLHGDQSSSSPGNAVLIDAIENPVPIYFFYKSVDDPKWEYQGQIDVVDYDYTVQDGRDVFVFQMEHRESSGADTETDPPTRSGLYLIPVSQSWYPDYERTVVTPFSINESTIEDFPQELTNREKVRIWGTTETDSPNKQTAIERMQTGDLILFYHSGDFVGAGRVDCLLTEDSVGEAIWSNPASRHAFTLLSFTTDPLLIDQVWPALGYEGRQVVQGFMRVDDQRVQNLIKELGAVEAVLNPSVEEIDDPDDLAVEHERKRLLESVDSTPTLTEDGAEYTEHRRRARDTAFARIVKELYKNTCAVCGSQRESPDGHPEVEAAHIYPKHENGSDDPRNGIALCQLHHWAFDAGWFGVSDEYEVIVQQAPSRVGYDEFNQLEGTALQLPSSDYRPHSVFLSAHRTLNGF